MATERALMDDPPRVAAVLDEYEVVLNKGSDDGIRMGETLLIYGMGPEISDPVTGRNLGPVERVRGRGRVIHVQKSLATVRSLETKPMYSPTNNMLMFLTKPQPTHYQDLPFKNVECGDLARPI